MKVHEGIISEFLMQSSKTQDRIEKVLAAHRSGIKTLIMPLSNEKDLVDIPKKVQKEIRFHFVDKMKDVLKLAIE